jgi:SAM-dependent methyltransferase
VISDFGSEWEKFDFDGNIHDAFIQRQFRQYLKPLPLSSLSRDTTVAADFGAGSGRWTRELIKLVRIVHSIEPSKKAFGVMERAFENNNRVILHNTTIEDVTLEKESLDFAMSLGVLHHIEKTQEAIDKIFSHLRSGGIFLGYLYYNFENKSKLYRFLWQSSNFLRGFISKLPSRVKVPLTEIIAFFVYWPLARVSLFVSKLGLSSSHFPLHQYANESLYVMRNDALDRFGTRLEKRFSKSEITNMLLLAGADSATINFSTEEPYWCFIAAKK